MVVTGYGVECFGRKIFPGQAGWMGVIHMNREAEEGAEIATEILLGEMMTVELYFEHWGWTRL